MSGMKSYYTFQEPVGIFLGENPISTLILETSLVIKIDFLGDPIKMLPLSKVMHIHDRKSHLAIRRSHLPLSEIR